jgi:hypothetical protein
MILLYYQMQHSSLIVYIPQIQILGVSSAHVPLLSHMLSGQFDSAESTHSTLVTLMDDIMLLFPVLAIGFVL